MIELRFSDAGPAYERAKYTADRLGFTVYDYLLECIAEGHRTLTDRALHSVDNLDMPAFERRQPTHIAPTDVEAALRKLREIPFREK